MEGVSFRTGNRLRIHSLSTEENLTRHLAVLQYPKFRRNIAPERIHLRDYPDNMTAKSPVPPSNVSTKQPCKHPRVQVVSRDEESEFVECKECGEIFESSEFKDMNIEDRIQDPEI